MPALLTDVFGAVTTDSEPKIVGHRVTGLRIFRAGTFADSEGVRRRFTRKDLDKMVENFNQLKDNGILPNVPVREDHSRSIKSVVGYFTAVRRDGNFLVADVEFTEEQAVQRYSSGTYRARSAEVGDYTDNDENVYSPCILGVAFCDIPAVEGLYAAQIQTYAAGAAGAKAAATVRKPTGSAAKPGMNPNWKFDPMTGEPVQNDQQDGDDGSGLMKDVLLDLHNLKDLYAGDPDTESALQQIVDALTSIMQDSDAPDDQANAGKSSAQPQGGQGNPRSNHSGDNVALIQFSLGGATVEVDDKHRDGIAAIQAAFSAAEKRATDAEATVATVTAERDTLRTEVQTAEFAARDAKIDALVVAKKITPGEVEALKAFAKTLSADQFTAQEAMLSGRPVLGFTAPAGTGAPAGPEGGEDEKAKIAAARQGYSMLKTAGVTGEKLAKSKFAKDLKALGVDPEGE